MPMKAALQELEAAPADAPWPLRKNQRRETNVWQSLLNFAQPALSAFPESPRAIASLQALNPSHKREKLGIKPWRTT